MEFATRYNPAESFGIVFSKPSLTQQHFKDECDINHIVATYQETGIMPQGNREPLFGDFAGIPTSFQESQNLFKEAQDKFYSLPSDLRKMLDNSPQKLLEFMSNPANSEACVKFGLFNKPPEKAPENKPQKPDNPAPPPVQPKETSVS